MPKPIQRKPRKGRPRLIGRMVDQFQTTLEGQVNRVEGFDSSLLVMSLEAAVPLWALQFKSLPSEARDAELRRLNDSDFCLRMEYVLHRGPKPGDSAKAFNDLARAIALMSFCPGGVRAFGRRWQWSKVLQRVTGGSGEAVISSG